MLNNFKSYVYLFLIVLFSNSCKKYLDQKPDKSMVIAGNLKDLQALLDDYNRMNHKDPSGGEISSDNYYLTYGDWNSLTDDMRQMFCWGQGDYFPSINNMWNNAWQPIYVANTVLEILPSIEITANNKENWNNIKGQALFFRAKEFHHIAITWSLAFDSSTSTADLGIPLRLNSDFNEKSIRSDLGSTYSRIIEDLKQAILVLPLAPISAYRPSKPAAYAILSRVYLSMRKYNLAEKYADSCLQLYNKLIDYNNLNPANSRPIPKLNLETIFYSEAGNWGPLTNSRAKIDSNLFGSYNQNDLRKTVFFKSNNNGTYGFKATYSGGTAQFTGVSTDEMFLTRAECRARILDVNGAMSDLNTLLIKRWKRGTFIPFSTSNSSEALNIILNERRKQLIYRELRWMDIKRLNKEGANIVLNRILNGQIHTLSPNTNRYALPLPEAVIEISGMTQNPR